jgi:hypothetical protein
MKYSEILAEIQQLGRFTRHHGQSHRGITGTMAAGLAAGSYVYGIQFPSTASGLYIPGWIHLHFVCLSAMTNAISAGRRLALRRGTGGAFTGGSDIDVVSDLDATGNTPLGNPESFGSTDSEPACVGKVASTAALTTSTSGGITFETAASKAMLLAHTGSAGQDYDELWTFDGLALLPGQSLGILAPAAFDAAGTWQLSVKGWGAVVQT